MVNCCFQAFKCGIKLDQLATTCFIYFSAADDGEESRRETEAHVVCRFLGLNSEGLMVQRDPGGWWSWWGQTEVQMAELK